ncbi:cupin domain-containing protein [Adhaeribacter rhizoryzae]|uniref:Cupin domain-containing protein n=1 Tax=Adhaeribacter rhizoryzae TaxID=2607907 RepID=A0A5M6CV45_9BACT|nr:cupin domain-containing protein [Adhaeribacter rhizoryzae]KAA5539117.1 cupin domain-containing protein [Adhaeribacter rhizoryzae]
MKRANFLLSCLVTIPLSGFRKMEWHNLRVDKGFKVSAGEGRGQGHIKLKGVNSNILDVKVSGKDTNGDLAIFEQTGLSPKRGTPLHIHPAQDEIFKIIEGEYYFQVGMDKYRLKAGDTIFLPRKVPHAWTQISEQAKMNVIVQPAGKLEEFFVTMAAFVGEPTKEQIAKIFSDHEMEVVGPPLKVD